MDKHQKITSKKQLINWFQKSEKSKQNWRIGTEHEKFIFSDDNFKPIHYEGKQGIKILLHHIMDKTGWKPILEKDNIIGLTTHNGSSISLEPGGQFELSGAPLKNLHMTCDETGTHLSELRETLKDLNLGMAGFGFHPNSGRDDFNFMPKGRYKIMRKWMPKVGSMGLDMMLRTCTIQVNLDFSDENDMVRKFRSSIAVQPIITALFANSPFKDGLPSGYLSLRSEVWRNTDPYRCGIPKCIFNKNFGYETWVNYLLTVPMYFIYRNGIYNDVAGSSFSDFMNGKLKGFEGQFPMIKDWEDHMSTVFTEVRLKGYLEMRGADAGPWNRICALPAIWVGLLYDENSLNQIEKISKRFEINEILEASVSCSKYGLKGKFGKFKVQDLARELIEISYEGLKNRKELDSSGQDESGFLSPLKTMVENGNTLADELLLKYNNNWSKSVLPAFKDQRI